MVVSCLGCDLISDFFCFSIYALLPVFVYHRPTTAAERDLEKDNRPLYCPSNLDCFKLGGECLDCEFPKCKYGEPVNVTCTVKPNIVCIGKKTFNTTANCNYCFQENVHSCSTSRDCDVAKAPKQRYRANCTVESETICMGSRYFYKYRNCNWSFRCKWSTALILR